MPSATTADSSDSMAPNMATAKALGSSIRTVPRLRPMVWPSTPGALQGHMKEGSTWGMPATRCPFTMVWKRLPMVSTSKPGIQRPRTQAATAAAGRARSGAGIFRRIFGRRTRRRLGSRGIRRMARVPRLMSSSQGEIVCQARPMAPSRSMKWSGTWSSFRPSRSLIWRTAITVAMPEVKPVVTGNGMNSMSFPMRSRPMPMSKSPASRPDMSRPESPNFT